MRFSLIMILAIQALLVAAFGVGLRSGWFPLGVPGEWEWIRLRASPEPISVFLAMFAVVLFATLAAGGFVELSRNSRGAVREGFWLAVLAMAAVGSQAVVQEAAPVGYGLSKWIIALQNPGSSGYYTVAKTQMNDPARFLADYPVWIARQDALHVGTHPPGLFVLARGMIALMDANPGLSRWVVKNAPGSVKSAMVAFEETQNLPRSDAAGLALMGALTLIACALTVVPLYLLARSVFSPATAWGVATLWPLVPSALLFQPTADAAFPLLATSSLALSSWATRSGSRMALVLGLMAGLTLALGMFFTLAFLPVGLVVALVYWSSANSSWSNKASLFAVTGAGFLLGTSIWWWATSASPFVIWWLNQKNHARFYAEYPRSYWAWLIENPLELAVGLGLSSALWGVLAFRRPRDVPRVVWSTLGVLIFLTLSGKNLSEVARLWLPLMPPLLVASGVGFTKLGGQAWTLGATVSLLGLQVLILEATIQVVYPF